MADNVTQHVARRIRELRESADGGLGWSQDELAKRCGTTGNTVSRWETGTYRPSLEDLERVARALRVSILDLLPGDEMSEPEPLKLLMRTARDLHPTDLEELQKYAEFRAARQRLSVAKPRRGRKPAAE